MDEKDPRFSWPPMQEGVPTYDTPNVPGYANPNSSGDVLLVELHPVEPGAYQPLPTDGSVVYGEKDKLKWPNPLYLCHEKLTNDGKKVFRFWANRRTRASQNTWNYGLQYVDEGGAFPIIVRDYTILRSDYVRTTDLAPDPVVATCLLVKEDMEELPDQDPKRSLFVHVRSIYMTLPGPILSGVRIDPRTGDLIGITKQKVLPGTSGTRVQADSTFSTVTPQTKNISEKVSDAMAGSSLITGQQWVEGKHVSLPRVLTFLTVVDFNDTDGNTIFNGIWYLLTDYSSAYPVTVTEKWNSTPTTAGGVTALLPQAFSWITPFGPGDIPECLHAEVEITGNTASDGTTPAGGGRFYAYIAWDFIFPATSPSSLAGANIVLVDGDRPERGGFIRRVEYINIP